MKHYTSTIPLPLAEKLKEKGMPMELVQHDVQGMIYADYAVTYAACLDWLMSEKGLHIRLVPTWDSPSDEHLNFEYRITRMVVPFEEFTDNVSYSLMGAAEKAIEKALTLI